MTDTEKSLSVHKSTPTDTSNNINRNNLCTTKETDEAESLEIKVECRHRLIQMAKNQKN